MSVTVPACRFCSSSLDHTFVDLGKTPLANSYVTAEDVAGGRDAFYSLHARVCANCLLVQVDDSVPPGAIFSDYAYFSSYATSWVEHARQYASSMKDRFGLGPDSMVVEVASNDGYLLQHFKNMKVPVLGVEPAVNVARKAESIGVPTRVAFFGQQVAEGLASEGYRADLTAANNVLAHVPGTLDFVKGFAAILKPEGVSTFEFPHILNLIRDVQFDTIYHEHFFYLSLVAVEKIFTAAGLRVFDVEELPTHGGSLRVYACRDGASHTEGARVSALRDKEHAAGLDKLRGYEGFAPRVEAVRRSFLAFLDEAKAQGKSVAAYGAAAKGNTFLNYCGITDTDMTCVFDRSLEKQNKLLPGSHLPIFAPERIADIKPDYLVILPWNLAAEVTTANKHICEWGGRFVVAIPDTRIIGP